jgi:superfamily II DNA/RNA helicase
VHRIGRTGRAGRNGLAVTLAERMDSGMIRRIQQFTTQPIPVATIGGLEPKSPEPRLHAPRRDARDGAHPRPFQPSGKRTGRRDGHEAPHGRAPFGRHGAPDRTAIGDPRRNPFDRPAAAANRDRPAVPFAPRKGSFADKRAPRPARPRSGGYVR